MRLTCPNCSAQYDIPEGMIPPEGREVQCSSCAQSWFQEGEEPAADAADDPEASGSDMQPRRPMADEATLDVLRQERAHEARARAAQRRRSRALSRTLPPGTEQTAPVPRSERERVAAAAEIARARKAERGEPGRDPDAAADAPKGGAASGRTVKPAVPRIEEDLTQVVARTIYATTDPGPARDRSAQEALPPAEPKPRVPRRDLLPDIEEINSSLRPDDRALGAEEAQMLSANTRADAQPPTSGFGLGFAAMVIAAFAAVSVYALSGLLIDAAPVLSAPLGRYAEWVDGLRAGLETRVDAFTSRITPEL